MEATNELINQRAAELCELHESILKDATTDEAKENAWNLFQNSYRVFLRTFNISGRTHENDGKYHIVWKRLTARAA